MPPIPVTPLGGPLLRSIRGEESAQPLAAGDAAAGDAAAVDPASPHTPQEGAAEGRRRRRRERRTPEERRARRQRLQAEALRRARGIQQPPPQTVAEGALRSRSRLVACRALPPCLAATTSFVLSADCGRPSTNKRRRRRARLQKRPASAPVDSLRVARRSGATGTPCRACASPVKALSLAVSVAQPPNLTPLGLPAPLLTSAGLLLHRICHSRVHTLPPRLRLARPMAGTRIWPRHASSRGEHDGRSAVRRQACKLERFAPV